MMIQLSYQLKSALSSPFLAQQKTYHKENAMAVLPSHNYPSLLSSAEQNAASAFFRLRCSTFFSLEGSWPSSLALRGWK
jgi:hypothetical protein